MNEFELIIECQNGEKEAFQELISFYYPYITKFLLRITSNEILAEDLTQETFLKLIRSIEKYDVFGRAAFSTYLVAIAKNSYIDHLRANKKLIPVDINEELYLGFSVEDTVFAKLQIDEILGIIDKLPREQGEAIKLKYLEQLTLEEIAARFACEPKTIKSRIHNGMVKLRQSLLGGDKYGG